jgi:hypothetical protein
MGKFLKAYLYTYKVIIKIINLYFIVQKLSLICLRWKDIIFRFSNSH